MPGFVRCFALLLFLQLAAAPVRAQHAAEKVSLKDSLDGAFDFSDFLIHANGFIPVASIITEPALGGFGGVVAPIFIKKREPYIDIVRGEKRITPVQPDITGGAALMTVNGTWGMFGFRAGTFVKSRIKYVVAGGYADVNMSYFRTFDRIGEKELKVNIKTTPVFLQAIRRIGFSHWYGGFKYLFLHTDVSLNDGEEEETNALTADMEKKSLVSHLGVILELDNRDNIFTPDNGFKIHIDAVRSDDAIGSDYEYWRMNYYIYAYRTFFKELTTGIRVDGREVFEDPPFFMLPYIDMRGIPINRYQGNADILTELELRWDFTRRWSAVFFSGAGKAFDEWSDFDDTDLVQSYGTGFRYLIARKFKLRMGVDVAYGADQWAYYIVFGSSWMK